MTHALVLWLVNGGLFEESETAIDRSSKFDNALAGITWPSSVGRLATHKVKQITSGGTASSIKADEWTRVRAVLPIALWLAWRNEETDKIESEREMKVYNAVIAFVASLRVLLSRSITLTDAEYAQDQLSSVCKTLLQCGMPLTINWHVAMHYHDFIRLYGPVGSYATWAYERNNGDLAKARYFKGNIVQMTTTASRKWLKEQLVRSVIDNPVPDPSEAEAVYLSDLSNRLDRRLVQGTFLVEEHRARQSSRTIRLNKPTRSDVDLRNSDMNVYFDVLDYLKNTVQLNIRSEMELLGRGVLPLAS
jgi:hypothetical protein